MLLVYEERQTFAKEADLTTHIKQCVITDRKRQSSQPLYRTGTSSNHWESKKKTHLYFCIRQLGSSSERHKRHNILDSYCVRPSIRSVRSA